MEGDTSEQIEDPQLGIGGPWYMGYEHKIDMEFIHDGLTYSLLSPLHIHPSCFDLVLRERQKERERERERERECTECHSGGSRGVGTGTET
jgi:hypothetical protein